MFPLWMNNIVMDVIIDTFQVCTSTQSLKKNSSNTGEIPTETRINNKATTVEINLTRQQLVNELAIMIWRLVINDVEHGVPIRSTWRGFIVTVHYH